MHRLLPTSRARPDLDDEEQLRVELRLARLRLERARPSDPEIRGRYRDVAVLKRELAALEPRRPGEPLAGP
jgi:hypothetical protein